MEVSDGDMPPMTTEKQNPRERHVPVRCTDWFKIMITSSGAMCDVCGHHILPIDPDEKVNLFGVAQMPGKELCCHNKCKQAVLDCGGDWQKLPDGPLRKAYEDAATQVA